MDLYKKGTTITAKQLLWVAQRPDALILLPEQDDNGVDIQENIDTNLRNKKYGDRFEILVDVFLPKLAGTRVWDKNHRCNRILSDYKMGSGEEERDAVPAAMEALVILYVANGMRKWLYEAEQEKKWGRALTHQDRKTEE